MSLATFRYQAVDSTGARLRGHVDAASQAAAVGALAERGLHVIAVSARTPLRVRGQEASLRDAALGLRSLSDLIGAGLPMRQVLATLRDVAPSGWRALLPGLQSDVEGGRPLAAALAAQRTGMTASSLGILRAGEAAGRLADGLRDAATDLEETQELRSALRSALAYPTLLVVAGSASLGFLIAVVLPRFAVLLDELGQALPRSTALVLAGAHILSSLAVPGAVLAVIASAALIAWWRMPGARTTAHAALLRVPLIGPVRLAAATSRSARALAMMLEVGAGAGMALRTAADAAGDAAIGGRFRAAADMVRDGRSISRALHEADALSPMVTRLARAGEEAGTLPAALRRGGALASADAVARTRTITRLVEPVVVLGFGGTIALVAAALLQALYAVRPT